MTGDGGQHLQTNYTHTHSPMAPVCTLQWEANYPKQAKNNNSVLRFKVKLLSKTRIVNAEDDEEKAIITDYVLPCHMLQLCSGTHVS